MKTREVPANRPSHEAAENAVHDPASISGETGPKSNRFCHLQKRARPRTGTHAAGMEGTNQRRKAFVAYIFFDNRTVHTDSASKLVLAASVFYKII